MAKYHRRRPDVVRLTAKIVFPVSGLPEAEPFGIGVVIAHGRVTVRCAMEIQINQLLEVRANDLVRINEDDLLQIHREEHIEEKDLVSPDDALLLFLSTEPRWPFVRYKLVFEVVGLREMGDEFLER